MNRITSLITRHSDNVPGHAAILLIGLYIWFALILDNDGGLMGISRFISGLAAVSLGLSGVLSRWKSMLVWLRVIGFILLVISFLLSGLVILQRY
jgi:hypothetical protein